MNFCWWKGCKNQKVQNDTHTWKPMTLSLPRHPLISISLIDHSLNYSRASDTSIVFAVVTSCSRVHKQRSTDHRLSSCYESLRKRSVNQDHFFTWDWRLFLHAWSSSMKPAAFRVTWKEELDGQKVHFKVGQCMIMRLFWCLELVRMGSQGLGILGTRITIIPVRGDWRRLSLESIWKGKITRSTGA